MKTNIVEKIKGIRESGLVNTRYCITRTELDDIAEHRHFEPIGVAIDSFTYGYAQGHKAALAEAKRKKVSA